MINKSNNKNNTQFIYFILLIIIIVFFDVLAMQCLKLHTVNKDNNYFFISCFIYGVVISFLILK